ncbi:hypothetical protein QQP08_006689 [Theobroma cacao]|nr:hypothetical protein QQP08_006689 [Theobroma cacao]
MLAMNSLTIPCISEILIHKTIITNIKACGPISFKEFKIILGCSVAIVIQQDSSHHTKMTQCWFINLSVKL